MQEVRLEKRGGQAWGNVAAGDKLASIYDGGTTRLLIHAVGDASLAQWIPKVRIFIHFCIEHAYPLTTPTCIDKALAVYMDHQ